MASTEGGVEIETVAAETPEKILRVAVDPALGPQDYQGRELAFGLGLEGGQISQFTSLFKKPCQDVRRAGLLAFGNQPSNRYQG